MLRRRVVLSILASVLAKSAWAGSLSPPGPPSSTMRSLSEICPAVTISSLPFTITQPGVYSLAQDLQAPPGTSNGITVLSSSVTIDLNGFSLRGSPSSQTGIFVEGTSGFVTVRNGSVRGWGGDGISCSSSSGISVVDVTVGGCAGDGIDVSSATLSGVVCVSNGGAGVRCEGDPIPGLDVRIRESPSRPSSMRSNGGGGVHMSRGSSVECVSVDIVGNTGDGIHVATIQSLPTQGSLYQTGGRCSENTGDGLHVQLDHDGDFHIQLRDVDNRRNSDDGIDISSFSSGSSWSLDAQGGSCDSNGATGMKTSSSGGGAGKATFKEFTFRSNVSSGVSFGESSLSSCTLDTCDFSSNGLYGIEDGGGSSTTDPECMWDMRSCTVTDNKFHGMFVMLRGIDKKDIRRGCSFSGNTGDGLHIESAVAGARLDLDCDDVDFSSNGGNGFSRVAHHPNVVSSLSFSSCDFSSNGVDGLDCDDDGDGISTSVVCADSSSSSNGGDGVSSRGRGSSASISMKLVRMELARNAGSGVDEDCDGLDRDDRLSMSSSSCVSNGVDGVSVVSHGTGGSMCVSLDSCALDSNVARGCFVDQDCDDFSSSLRCADSSFSSNGLDGASVSLRGSTITCATTHLRCVFDSNGGNGFVVGDEECDDGDARVTCTDSSFSSNVLDGMLLSSLVTTSFSSHAQVDSCDLVGNGGSGLHRLGSGGGGGGCALYVSSSSCSSNGGSGIDDDTTAMTTFSVLLDVDDSDCDDNDADGIHASVGPVGSSSSVSVSSSSVSRNGGRGCTCTCDTGFSAHELRATGNFSDGIFASGQTVVVEACDSSRNGGNGMRLLASDGVVHRGLASRNALSGIVIEGNNFDVSECRVMGHRSNTGVAVDGIRVDGTGSHLHNNFVSNNDNGFHLVSGTNPLYDNGGSSNANPLFVEAAAIPDNGPPSSAAAAFSPTSNIGF